MDQNPYVELTAAFNRGRLRAVLSSGQAVVLHRLAVMSKDGDWILREDNEALGHVLAVLEERGAHYRFGAPLDRRWLSGGWSAHLEHRLGRLRLRTDFVSRPPRLSKDELARVWEDEERLLWYREAAREWAEIWPGVNEEIAGRPLREAHERIVARAQLALPITEPYSAEETP